MLELEGIWAGYGKVTVLQDVSLTVPDSTVVALLGPNGAGKTTLLRTAAGLLAPAEGRVVLDGEDITGKPAHEVACRGLCHLPEGRGIFPSLSVHDNLVLESPKGRERQSIAEALKMFPRLGERMRMPAGRLSGGEQQMLALVRAFVSEAKVVLVDEVSLGLAPAVVEQTFEVLRKLAETGTSVLLVEQYVSKALDLASIAYLLNRGAIVFNGPSAELKHEQVFDRYFGIEATSL